MFYFHLEQLADCLQKTMIMGENNELHWFWRFFFVLNFIFLNRDFGCIKTRIYNLFGLSVLNSTFICCSTITTNECFRQTSLLARLAFTSIVDDICPPSCFAMETKWLSFFTLNDQNDQITVSGGEFAHQYRYFLGSFGGAKRHHVQLR